MGFLEAILLGIFQGLTEFLPVSSSGHLAIFKQLMDLEEVGIAFDILLHVGTLVAVCVAFRQDVWELVVNGFGIIFDFFKDVVIFFKNLTVKEDKKEKYIDILSTPYRRFVMLIIVSTIPTGIIGVFFKIIGFDEFAGSVLFIPGIGLIITSILLFIADRLPSGDDTAETASYGKALFIGLCQGIATLPGISRSGTTITACLGCKFDREFAVKYSFIMSIPAILGAAVLDVPDLFTQSLPLETILAYIAGTVASGLVGYVCIKTMLKVVKQKKFIIFSIYCLIAGITVIVLNFLV